MMRPILPTISAALLALSACSFDKGDQPPPESMTTSVAPVPSIAFIRNSVRTDVSRHALVQGELLIDDNGCIRVGGEDGPFIIWHYDTTLSLVGTNQLEITDGYTGKRVFIGEEIAMAGSGENRVPPASGHQLEIPGHVSEPIPEACASGEIWWAGPLLSEEERERILNP